MGPWMSLNSNSLASTAGGETFWETDGWMDGWIEDISPRTSGDPRLGTIALEHVSNMAPSNCYVWINWGRTRMDGNNLGVLKKSLSRCVIPKGFPKRKGFP